MVRIDGKGFHKLSDFYRFAKPNDIRALNLMNAAAQHTLHVLPDIIVGYGHSDEYSFVFHKSTTLFERRSAKIASTVVSTFTAAYVYLWPKYFGQIGLSDPNDDSNSDSRTHEKAVELNVHHLPTFDSRAVLYPSIQNLKDYLSWRQADCHINNLYNTTFWNLVQKSGMSNTEAEKFLKGTLSADKNEILWSRFGLNYNNELQIFRKGSVVFRLYEMDDKSNSNKSVVGCEDNPPPQQEISRTQQEKLRKARQKAEVVIEHIDIIKDDFWYQRPWLLSGQPGKPVKKAS